MPTNRKRIQTYVSPTTYAWIQAAAEDEGVSVSEYVATFLQTCCVDGFEFSVPAMQASQYATKQDLDSIVTGALLSLRDEILGKIPAQIELYFASKVAVQKFLESDFFKEKTAAAAKRVASSRSSDSDSPAESSASPRSETRVNRPRKPKTV